MTDQELKQLLNLTYQDVQDENGIDVTQIDHLLSLSPTDRLRTLEEFLEDDEAFVEARERHEAEAARADRKTAHGGR